jgi:hypothetical protein
MEGLRAVLRPASHLALLRRLTANNNAEKIAMMGPAVADLNTNTLRRNPAATERRLTAEEAKRKCDSLSCCAADDGVCLEEERHV